MCRKVCLVKWLTKLHVKKDLRDQQDSYQGRLVLFKVYLYLWQGGGGEVTLLSSSFVSLPTTPASVTWHSNSQETRVGLCKLARDTTVIRMSEVEDKLRSYNQLQKFWDTPRKTDLSCFKSLLVTGLWDVILTSLLPPIQSYSSKFWAWSCIANNFDKGWRGVPQAQDHGQAIYAKIRYIVWSTNLIASVWALLFAIICLSKPFWYFCP